MTQATFVKPAFKDTLLMVKINCEGKEQWATCSQQSKVFAKNNFSEGQSIEFEGVKKDGKWNITKFATESTAVPQQTSSYTPPPTSSTGFSCEVCGKELKDGKYKKCYTCNMSAKEAGGSGAKTNYSKTSKGGNSTEVNESIKRQAIGHMTSRALLALQGQVDPNTIEAVAERLYRKFQELVG